MFVRELTTTRRVVFGIVAIVALISAAVCGSLALTEPTSLRWPASAWRSARCSASPGLPWLPAFVGAAFLTSSSMPDASPPWSGCSPS